MNGCSPRSGVTAPASDRGPVFEIDRDHLVVLRRFADLGQRKSEQSEVDAVPIEDPREAAGDHALDARGLHRPRHVLSRRARAEVGVHDERSVAAEALAQRRIEPLEEMVLHQLGVVDVEVRPGVQHVGVDVVAVDADDAGVDPHSDTGSTISPATAAAPAT